MRFVWPGAVFWRLWGTAAALSALVVMIFLGAPADAETMRASFYSSESGPRNADGSAFNPMGFTAAHRSLPFGTQLRVCFRACAVVTVRDRGPYVAGRSLDLARGAARAIGLEPVGVANINVEILGYGVGVSVGPERAGRDHHHRRHHRP